MLKFLLVTILILYLMYKVGFFLLKTVFRHLSGENADEYRNQQKRKPRDGNVHIDYIPKKGKSKRKKGATAGDYVDYEEIK